MNLIWLHGWGQSKVFIEPLFTPFVHQYKCYAIDLPGFGSNPAPETVWGSADYADYVAQWMEEHNIQDAIIIGHSLGGKIAAQMAIRHPKKTLGIVMLAASGLPRKRSIRFKIKAWCMKKGIQLAKLSDSFLGTKFKEKYANKVGSADYRAAKGIMRNILICQIKENLADIVKQIAVPALIVYGDKDKDTPPEVGKKFHDLIKDSLYVELPNQDHYSVLQQGRAQVQNQILKFLQQKFSPVKSDRERA